MHGVFDQLGPDDFLGETDADRDRESKHVPAREGDLRRPATTNNDIERMHEPMPEETAQ